MLHCMTVRGVQPGIVHFFSISCIGHNRSCKHPVGFNTVVNLQKGLTSNGECVCVCVGGGVSLALKQ